MVKKWYKSKTIWFNVAVGLTAAGNELLPVLDLMEGDGQEVLRAYLIVALSVGNTILRIVTKTKVTV